MDGKTSQENSGLAATLELHRGELLRFLAARCGDPAQADDLLQELWIKAAAQAAGPVGNPRAYLFRMANNLVLDQRRAQRRAMARDRGWLEEDGNPACTPGDRLDPSEPADEALMQAQEAELLHSAIEQLPAGAQRALVLFRIEGRSHAEIAEIMGISRSGVEKHLARAMKLLRDALAGCGYFGSAASGGQDAEKRMELRTEDRS